MTTFEIDTDKKTVPLTVTIPIEMRDRLRVLAKEKGLRISNLVEQMLRYCLQPVA